MTGDSPQASMDVSASSPAEDHDWVVRMAARAEGRPARTGGYIACLLGCLVMITGRFGPGAPVWLVYAGLGGVVFGWGLLGLSVYRRAAYVTKHARGSQG